MSDKESLLEVFERIRQALFDCDTGSLQELIAEDYVGYDPAGNPQDLGMTLEAYQPGAARLDRYDVEDVEVRIIGEVGVITGKGYIHGTFARLTVVSVLAGLINVNRAFATICSARWVDAPSMDPTIACTPSTQARLATRATPVPQGPSDHAGRSRNGTPR